MFTPNVIIQATIRNLRRIENVQHNLIYHFTCEISDHLQNCHPELEWGDHTTGGILQDDNFTGGKYLFKLYNSRYYLFYRNKFMKKKQ